jgi:hypothetical protein
MAISLGSVSGSAMHGAVVPIATAVGTGSSNTITFNNIPQVYQDLFIVGFITLDASGTCWIYSNGYGATTYSNTTLLGNGSSATSSRNTSQAAYTIVQASGIGSTYPVSLASHILNYANTTTYKTVLTRNAADKNGSGATELNVGMKSSTSAITSLDFNTFGAANFTTSTRISLYGIRTIGQ